MKSWCFGAVFQTVSLSCSDLSMTVSASRVKSEWDFNNKIIFQRLAPVQHVRDPLMGQYALHVNGKPFSTICKCDKFFTFLFLILDFGENIPQLISVFEGNWFVSLFVCFFI